MPSVNLFPTKNRNAKDKRPVKPMPFDIGLRKFKKACERAGIIEACRKQEFYEKPTAKRKRKKAEAINRSRKQERLTSGLGSTRRRR